jgi:hypothetical protein
VGASALAACSVANQDAVGDLPTDCGADIDRQGDPAGKQDLMTAVPTHIDATTWTDYVVPLQLCPAGDRDVFAVDLRFAAEPVSLDARVTTGVGQAAPTVELLDAESRVMRTAKLESGATLLAHLDDLVATTIYVRVAAEHEVSYALELVVGKPGVAGEDYESESESGDDEGYEDGEDEESSESESESEDDEEHEDAEHDDLERDAPR